MHVITISFPTGLTCMVYSFSLCVATPFNQKGKKAHFFLSPGIVWLHVGCIGLSRAKWDVFPKKNPSRKHLLRDSSSKLPCNFFTIYNLQSCLNTIILILILILLLLLLIFEYTYSDSVFMMKGEKIILFWALLF